jgi:hypothetical protein
MKKLLLPLFLLLGVLVGGCKDFVNDIQPPNNSVADNLLNDPSQTEFVVKGVVATFEDAFDQISCLGDALSDAFVFDTRLSTATYPTYLEIENGTIRVNNSSVEDAEAALGRLRLYADTLVSRAAKINYAATTHDSDLKNLALFTGNFYGGIARYFYASYFGLSEENGGGCINLGPFIPSNQMYDLALDRLKSALLYATPALEPVVHTLMARIELYKGDFVSAAADAAKGMQSERLLARYSTEADNFWWSNAGSGRLQFIVDQRFPAYVAADPKESARIPLAVAMVVDSITTLYQQDKYPSDTSSIAFLTWQENELIVAELASRSGDDGVALTHVNNVRTFYGLDPATATNLDSIYIERDKELFATGARVIDQRRFKKWHLPAGTWMYLPITQLERTANPNLH